MTKTDIVSIGTFCKKFRENNLKSTLTNFCVENGENIKNVSAFESGRANNIKYLFLYYSKCKTDEEKRVFCAGLFNLL